jgi:AcrR family transcriptional regulator
MSTSVDKNAKRPRLSAEQTRSKILDAAALAFTRAGYDAVGVREIAQNAGVDPAMISRLFGSKEDLFRAIADKAFSLSPAFDGPLEGLGERIARHLLGPIGPSDDASFDEFAFLLGSVGSPAAAPILSAALHRDFIEPLAKRLPGHGPTTRAALVTSYVMGFAVLRAGLGSPAIESADAALLTSQLARAIQNCLDSVD